MDEPNKPEGRIVSAQAIPWERGTLFAVAYEFEKRFRGAFQVGSQSLAEKLAYELVGKDHEYLENEIRRAHERLGVPYLQRSQRDPFGA
jgi:hypothetical protein